MGFVLDVAVVLVGAFILFTISNVGFRTLVPESGGVWLGLIFTLSVANMAVHKWLLSGQIDLPFYTALLFGMSLTGLYASDDQVSKTWCKRAAYAVAFGSLLGWTFFAEIRTV